ncbi:P-loop ATPase [Candidatus Falkowbacteria bacterium]|nr:MAG: P-loop ATPase [Candidatus Falkowbacteria bacterium]
MRKNNTKIIGITGGKGGTGKSTVATALAYELAKKHKVLLVDADVDCPNDHLLLGIKRKFLKKVEQRIPAWDFKKCVKCGLCGTVCETNSIVSIKGKKPIFIPEQCNGCGACAIKCPEKAISWTRKEIGKIYTGSIYNINFLSGELEINQPISEFVVNSLNDIITTKKNKFDYVIVDTAAGTHCPVIAAVQMCDIVFAVTEPTPLGGHDLNLILKLLKKLRIKSGIILNRSDIGKKDVIISLANKHKINIIAEIPYSKKIFDQYVHGKPITIKNMELQKILRIIFPHRSSVI